MTNFCSKCGTPYGHCVHTAGGAQYTPIVQDGLNERYNEAMCLMQSGNKSIIGGIVGGLLLFIVGSFSMKIWIVIIGGILIHVCVIRGILKRKKAKELLLGD